MKTNEEQIMNFKARYFNDDTFPIPLVRDLVILVAAGVLLVGSVFTIQQYETGVVTTWGKFSYTASPGLGFKLPLVQRVTHFRTDIRQVSPTTAVNTYTEDNQEIDILFTVFYRVPADKVAFVYENVQDYYQRLSNLANDRVKSQMGLVKLEHFAAQRKDIRDTILVTLKQDALMLGIEVTDFQFTDVAYTKAFRNAVEAASVQKAGVETQEWKRQQAEKDAQTAKTKAEGEANAAKAKADGESYALLKVATAQADALRIQNAALAQNKDVLELRRIEVEMSKANRWDGKLPVNMYAGAPIPLLRVDGK